MSSVPDNQFHQFSLTGVYNFTPVTKRVTNGTYARNWQNQTILLYNTLVNGGGALPTSSLNGDVETKAVDLKLTHKVNNDLNFASSYKEDERENNTPVHISDTAAADSVIGGCINSVQAMNNSAKTDPCHNWFTDMSDNIDTVGFGVKRKGFLDGKLDVNGNIVYSFARTLIGVTGGQYVQGPTGTSTNGPFFYIPASNMPTVKTQTFHFKLDAKYAFNKPSAIHLSYIYQHLLSTDDVYTGMQAAGTPSSILPTHEQAPLYSIHAVGSSYIYNF